MHYGLETGYDARQMPLEHGLFALPYVESGYNRGHCSSSGGGHLGNFMPATGEVFSLASGLVVRRPPATFTARPRAALVYLTKRPICSNGDWLLWPLPPYNCGEGFASGRAISSAPAGWDYPPGLLDLQWPQETMNYGAQIAGHVADHRPPACTHCTARPWPIPPYFTRSKSAASLTCTRLPSWLTCHEELHALQPAFNQRMTRAGASTACWFPVNRAEPVQRRN